MLSWKVLFLSSVILCKLPNWIHKACYLGDWNDKFKRDANYDVLKWGGNSGGSGISEPSNTVTGAARSGKELDVSDKIQLGIGIGVGVGVGLPAMIVSIWQIMQFRKRNKNKGRESAISSEIRR